MRSLTVKKSTLTRGDSISARGRDVIGQLMFGGKLNPPAPPPLRPRCQIGPLPVPPPPPPANVPARDTSAAALTAPSNGSHGIVVNDVLLKVCRSDYEQMFCNDQAFLEIN